MSDDTPTQRYPDGFPPPGGRPPGESGQPDAAPTGPTQPLVPAESGPESLPPEPAPPVASPLADAPTERFASPDAFAAASVPPAVVPPAGTPPPGGRTSDDERRSRGLIIGLAIAGGVLLLALIALLIWLATSQQGPTPTESSTPTATASETPPASPTPTPTPTETEEPPPPPPPPADAIATFTASAEQVDCTAAGGTSVPLTFSWAATGNRLWFGVGTDDASANPYKEYPLNYTMDEVPYQCGQPGQQQRYTITVERTDGTHESKTLIIREI
jgi:hypothetical protein